VANKVKNANASAQYGANAGYEAEDWQMADALPGSMGTAGISCAVVGAETVVCPRFLPDWHVPGHPEELKFRKELDDLLASF
jgi:hypothetical protein